MQIYPKVFKLKDACKIYVECEGSPDIEIKIQPMEVYAIPHGQPQRLNEENRYPYVALTEEGGGVYSTTHVFTVPGRHSVRIRRGGEVVHHAYLYAVPENLLGLCAFKGETHSHSCRSDGKSEPFNLMLDYLAAGFDFATLTDHHKYQPSLEARDALLRYTDIMTVFPGEEVHNKQMAYFHVVNFAGESGVNKIIENDEYVLGELQRIKAERVFPVGVNPDTAAYRIFISEHIRRAGGVSILAHPFWDVYGEYNMELSELRYHLREGNFDALELLACNDRNGNGDNLTIAVWGDLRAEGVRTSIVGASDNHNSHSPYSLFDKNFTLVFATDVSDVPNAIRSGSCVAVKRVDEYRFQVYGEYSLVAYSRFLLEEMYPTYTELCSVIAAEILASGDVPSDSVRAAEAAAREYRERFFAKGVIKTVHPC